MREAKRILLAPKLWGLLALLLAVNLALFVIRDEHSAAFYPAYREALQDYAELSPEEALERLDAEDEQIQEQGLLYAWFTEQDGDIRDWLRENCAEIFGEDFEARIKDRSLDLSEDAMSRTWLRQEVLRTLRLQLEHLRDYPAYLSRVQTNAKQMAALSIFNAEDSFSLRNIEKTGRDFPQEVTVRLGNDFAVNALFSDELTGWMLLIFTLFLTLQCVEERKQGLWSLVHGAPRGRGRLALRRILILLVGVCFGTAVLLGGRLALCAIRCGGLGDLSRTVQSAAIFSNFPWVMPIRTAFLCFFVLKALGMWLVALAVWAILQAVNHLPLALGTAGAALAVEYALFRYIPDSYAIVILRYANLFALVDLPSVALRYLNVNCFGWPVQGFLLSLGLIPPILGVLIFVNRLLAENKKPVSRQNPVLSVFDRLRVPFSFAVGRLRLFGLELHKLLWQQKGLLVLAALAMFSFGYLEAPNADTELYDTELAGISFSLQGPITEETLGKLDEMIAECADWELSEGTLRRQAALSRLREKLVESLDAGDGLWLINQAPIAALIGKDVNYQRRNAVVLLLVLVLLLSGVFAQERQNRMSLLLRGSPCGRGKLWRSKLAVALLLTGLVWILFEAGELRQITETYGPMQLPAPIQSFDFFAGLTYPVSLGLGVSIYLLLRLSALCAAACAICFLSRLCRQINSAILLCSVVLVLPACLCWMGVPMTEYLSVSLLLSPTEVSLRLYGIAAALAVLLCWLSRKHD